MMNRAQIAFTVIDAVFDRFQNEKRQEKVKYVNDYEYGDLENNKADLYFIEKEGDYPILINMHGGGFVKGDKKYRRSISEDFAAAGFFVINMNYRLAPKYPFPAAFEDVFTLLNGLEKLKEKYRLNLEKIILTGDSSGGYMATHTTALLLNDDLRVALGLAECGIKPTALIAFSPFIDVNTALRKRMILNMTKSVAESISGLKLDKKMSALDTYKYINHICPLEFINEDWCKTLVVYAQKDKLCGGQGEVLMERLRSKNIECEEEFTTTLLKNHCYHLIRKDKVAKKARQKAIEFALAAVK